MLALKLINRLAYPTKIRRIWAKSQPLATTCEVKTIGCWPEAAVSVSKKTRGNTTIPGELVRYARYTIRNPAMISNDRIDSALCTEAIVSWPASKIDSVSETN